MDKQPIFNFEVIKVLPTPLNRQIFEALKISTDGYLNARCEYRQNQVKRLTVNLTDREHKAEEALATRLDTEVAEAVRARKTKLEDLSSFCNKGSDVSPGYLFDNLHASCDCQAQFCDC